jgi:hypothetical protein
MQDEVLATELEYTRGCQDPFNSQDLYNRAIKLLAAICDSELEHNNSMDSGPKEDTNITSVPQPAKVAMASQESVIAIDDQSASPLAMPVLDDPGVPQQVVEVANDKQEWEICGIIDKEDIDGVLHYWVQWSPTLVPKYKIGKASALVAKFEAGLRAQRKQKSGKERGRLLPSKAGKQAAAGVCTTGQTQEGKLCGRLRRQV